MFEPIINFISNFNSWSTSEYYQYIYWGLLVLFFTISFALQTHYDKYCGFVAEVIRIIHHLSVFFVYCAVLAPINSLPYLSLFSVIAVALWILNNNTCFLTQLERVRCHYKKNYRFHDLFYYIDFLFNKYKFHSLNIDKINIKYRVRLLVLFINIILLRLYVSYVI